MPYIKQSQREALDPAIDILAEALKVDGFDEGDMNYAVTRLLHEAFKKCPRYSTANRLVGMLECAKMEFYRRQVAPYEDIKAKINGDVT